MSKQYITKQGDQWDSIALSQYGSISYTDKLMMANGEYIGTYVFPAGITLEIPDLEETDVSQDMLPPWKRVS